MWLKDIRRWFLLLCFIGISSRSYGNTTQQVGNHSIRLFINDMLIRTEQMPPVQKGGYTLVPAREVFQETGAMVLWKSSEQKVYVDQGDSLIVLELNNQEAWVNGEIIPLDLPAMMINSKVMIPIRFVAEALGYEVRWQADEQSIYIRTELSNKEQEENIINKEESEGMVETFPQDKDDKENPSIEGETLWIQQEHIQYLEESESLELIGIEALDIASVEVEELYHSQQIIVHLKGEYSAQIQEGIWNKSGGTVASLEIQVEDAVTHLILKTRTIQALEVYESDQGLILQCVKPQHKYKKIVVIDAGHGAHDAGAVYENILEKDLVLKYALALGELLEKNQEIKVYFTREGDTFLELNERAEMANQIGADLFISLHVNAAGTATASGIETYYTEKEDNRNEIFARIVQEALVDTFKKKDRGVKSNTYVVTKKTEIPSVLIEIGFITNTEDRLMMTQESFANQYAAVLYQCILSYYEQGYEGK